MIGVPRTLEIEVLTCWADTVPYVGDGIPEAAELLGNRGIGLGLGLGLGLGERFLCPDYPEVSAHGTFLVSHFAERISPSSPGDYFTDFHVNELIDAMRGVLGDDGVQPLVRAAVARRLSGGSTDH